jgi:hypothetical protein
VSAAADALVYDALMAKVGEFTYNPVIPVSWPDVAFSPHGAPYIAPTVMPAETTQYSVQNAGTQHYRGVLQVSVYWPESEQEPGENRLLLVAAALRNHFAKGTTSTRGGVTVRVPRPPTITGAVDEAGWRHVPVTVPYEAFV